MTDRGRALNFGTFELDPSTNELRRSGEIVKLQAQHLQLLTLLAERAGEVVTREEIRHALWGDQTFVDFDRSISFGINQIRSALRDDPRSPRYIETLPRKGYRFIAPVARPESEANEAPNLQVEPSPQPREVSKRFRPVWLLAAVAGVAIVLVASNVDGLRDRFLGRSPSIQSVAVLPLANLSHDPAQEYFAEGMTEALITSLAKISALRVVSRTSVIQFAGSKKSLPEIARELNVDAIVEGTVLRASNQVRITAQLVRASPEQHLWAETYQGSVDEVLTLQDKVAQAVAHSIQVKLTPQERNLLETPRTVNAEAYEAYLKGVYFMNHQNAPEETLQKAKEAFQQATVKDPSYALGWSGLGTSYAWLGMYGNSPRAEAYPLARQAAAKALELDSDLPDPLAVLGQVKTEYEWDWTQAEQMYRQAIKKKNAAEFHLDYAVHLAEVGRAREAVAEAQRAHEAEPQHPGMFFLIGWFSYIDHQYEQAERVCSETVRTVPLFYGGHDCLAGVYLQTGRERQAVAEARRAVEVSNRGIMELMYLGHALAVSGSAEAYGVLQQMMDLSTQRYVPPEYIAVVYAGMGDKDNAFQWLDAAIGQRSMQSWVYPDPRIDSLRSDPRFKEVARRMGMPK